MEFAFKLHNVSQIWNLPMSYTRFLKYGICLATTQDFSNMELAFKLHKVSQIWIVYLNYTIFLKCGIYFWITQAFSNVGYVICIWITQGFSNMEFALKYTKFLKCRIGLQITKGFSNAEFAFGIHNISQMWNVSLRVAFCNTFDFLCVLIHIWIKGEVGAVKPV